MATVTNQFNRYPRKDISYGNTTGIISGSGVPLNTDMTAMGLIVTNTFDSSTNTPITVNVALKTSTDSYYLVKRGRVPEGESLIVIGWDQKLVLKTGDDIIIDTTKQVTGYTSLVGGSGYVTAPKITVSGGGGSGATAVANINSGAVVSITITNCGTGYVSVPSFVFDNTGTSGGGASATPVVTSETVDAVMSVLEITTS